MPDIFEVRRRNLVAYIQDKHEGNRAEFCRAIGKNPNLINLALTKNKEYRKNIGEKLARDIEQQSGMPSGWLDQHDRSPSEPTVQVPVTTGDPAIDGKFWLSVTKSQAKKLASSEPLTMLLVVDADEEGNVKAWGNRMKLTIQAS